MADTSTQDKELEIAEKEAGHEDTTDDRNEIEESREKQKRDQEEQMEEKK